MIDYKFIDELVNEKRYDELLIELKPFITTHLIYIMSGFNVDYKNDTNGRLTKFLRRCGQESYYCVKHFYCVIDKQEIESDIIYCLLILAKRYKYQINIL